jgi:hypothetical protein
MRLKIKQDGNCFLPLAILAVLLFAHRPCSADEIFPLDGYRVSGARAAQTSRGLQVVFGTHESWPNITWRSPGDAGWDWSQYNAVVLTLANPGAENVSFHVKITDHGEDGKKHDTQLSGNVPAGQTGRFYVSLEPRSLQQKSGMRALPPVVGDYGTCLGGGVEPGHIEELQIFRAMPTRPATLIIPSIVLAGRSTKLDLNGIIDRYGQYTRADWPGKVRSDADLLAQKAAEAADLEAHPGPADRSSWGGWAGGPRQKATGFFRTADSYAAYVRNVLSEPAFVGCHWFQYYDEPTTGRGQDGENFNIGFASITDTPYPELIAAARSANAEIYPWHQAAKAAATAVARPLTK